MRHADTSSPGSALPFVQFAVVAMVVAWIMVFPPV